MLRAAKALGESETVRVERTLLALHALAARIRGPARGVSSELAIEIDPAGRRRPGAGERGRRLLRGDRLHAATRCARCSRRRADHGLRIKLHAEQLSNLQRRRAGRRLWRAFGRPSRACRRGRASRRWRAPGWSRCCCPAPSTRCRETRKPPVDLLRRYGVPMAVATDCNPGTSPVLSPTLMMSMACTLFGLTPEEALAGMTREGARALGLQDEIGTISAGKAADLCIWRIGRPAELCYWIGMPRARAQDRGRRGLPQEAHAFDDATTAAISRRRPAPSSAARAGPPKRRCGC